MNINKNRRRQKRTGVARLNFLGVNDAATYTKKQIGMKIKEICVDSSILPPRYVGFARYIELKGLTDEWEETKRVKREEWLICDEQAKKDSKAYTLAKNVAKKECRKAEQPRGNWRKFFIKPEMLSAA